MSKIIITHQQCKAARDLLGWAQDDLSKKSKITKSTIADFERGVRNLRMGTLETIVDTFEKAGIRFENNETEFGVKLLKKNK
jgi:transcriptional regulator with XRE-family HTH domain